MAIFNRCLFVRSVCVNINIFSDAAFRIRTILFGFTACVCVYMHTKRSETEWDLYCTILHKHRLLSSLSGNSISPRLFFIAMRRFTLRWIFRRKFPLLVKLHFFNLLILIVPNFTKSVFAEKLLTVFLEIREFEVKWKKEQR